MFRGMNLEGILISIPVVLWAICFHEFCHAWVAWKLGDKTAAYEGRLSLNPLVHLDPIGALMLLVFRFGWARPVPINSRFFKHPRRDIILVSLAGVAGNMLTAGVCALIYALLYRMVPWLVVDAVRTFAAGKEISTVWGEFLYTMIWLNIALAVFNLIPIPPLDGSKILGMLLPPRAMRAYFLLDQYGMYILFFLLTFTPVFQWVVIPIVNLLFEGFLSLAMSLILF